MTPCKFEYHAPETVGDACRLLMEKGDDALVMSGGTDLLVKIRHGLLRPTTVIGLKSIEGLDQIVFHKTRGLTIGATALLVDVASNPFILKKYPALAYAAGETATVQIRNMGTLVGNLCNAAPSADNAPTLIALEAEVILTSSHEKRTLPLEKFFKGPGKTAMKQGEILTSVMVPVPPPHSGSSYRHISARGKVDISAVGVGASLQMDGKRCMKARIVLGAVAPIPLRAVKAEKLITGKALTEDLMERAGIQAAKESKPITDVRATKAYRKAMVAVLTKRALLEAKQRAER